MVVPSSLHEYCICDYDVSPGFMESSGFLLMMKRLHTSMGACAYYEYMFSDDDTIMKNYLTRPEKISIRKDNTGGYLSKEIYVPRGLLIQPILLSVLQVHSLI